MRRKAINWTQKTEVDYRRNARRAGCIPFLMLKIPQKYTFSEKIIDIYSGAGQMRRTRTTNAKRISAESSAKRDIDAGNRPDY